MSLPHSPLQSSRFTNMWPERGRCGGCPIDCDDRWQCRSGCADPNLKCSYCKMADGWWATRSLPGWCSRATATRRKRCKDVWLVFILILWLKLIIFIVFWGSESFLCGVQDVNDFGQDAIAFTLMLLTDQLDVSQLTEVEISFFLQPIHCQLQLH